MRNSHKKHKSHRIEEYLGAHDTIVVLSVNYVPSVASFVFSETNTTNRNDNVQRRAIARRGAWKQVQTRY